jgi:X-X-X-Leu-X-X-Gly heptad repeat protein
MLWQSVLPSNCSGNSSNFKTCKFISSLLTTLNLQRRTGTFVAGATQDQIASAEGFATELDKLSKLTGQQRTVLAKQIESQLANERFTAFLGGASKEAQQRLSAFSASIGELAPGLKEGFQDLIANSGTPVTEAARMLVQNIPEASGIIQQLTAGTLDSAQAMIMLRDAAQRSNKALAGVAVTGKVPFARLYSEVSKLASAELDLKEVTEEQKAAQDKATKSLALFQDSTKRLSSSFQSIETGFYTVLGGFIGTTGNQLNNGVKDIADGINKMNNGTKALLFMSKTIGGFFLDKGGQIAIQAAGTAAGIRMAGGGMGGAGGVGDLLSGKVGKGLKIGAGIGSAAGVIGGTGMAYQSDTAMGKAAGIGTSAMSGAVLGATIGSVIPGIGTGIGAIIGGIGGLVSGGVGAGLGAEIKRYTGTFG